MGEWREMGGGRIIGGLHSETTANIIVDMAGSFSYAENVDFTRVAGAVVQRGAFKRLSHVDATVTSATAFDAVGQCIYTEQAMNEVGLVNAGIIIRSGTNGFPMDTTLASGLGLPGGYTVDFDSEPFSPDKMAVVVHRIDNSTELLEYDWNAGSPAWKQIDLIPGISGDAHLNHHKFLSNFDRAISLCLNRDDAGTIHPRGSFNLVLNTPTNKCHSFARAFGRLFTLEKDPTVGGMDNLKFLHFTAINGADWSGGGFITLAGSDRPIGITGNERLLWWYGNTGVGIYDPGSVSIFGMRRIREVPIDIDNALALEDSLFGQSTNSIYEVSITRELKDLLYGAYKEQYQRNLKFMGCPPMIQHYNNRILFPVRFSNLPTNSRLMYKADALSTWCNGILVFHRPTNTWSLWKVSLNSFTANSINRLMAVFGDTIDNSVNVLWYDENSTIDYPEVISHTAMVQTPALHFRDPFADKTLGYLNLYYEGQASNLKIYYSLDAPTTPFHLVTWTQLGSTINDTSKKAHVKRFPLPDRHCNTVRIKLEWSVSDPRDFVLLGWSVSAYVDDRLET